MYDDISCLIFVFMFYDKNKGWHLPLLEKKVNTCFTGFIKTHRSSFSLLINDLFLLERSVDISSLL